MITTTLRSILIVIGLSVFNNNAWALLISDKTTVNNETGTATVSVKFPTPVAGDLYLATLLNGQLFFFADSGKKITPEPLPYLENASFSDEKVVLKLAPEGVPPNVYPLYQVITLTNKSPLDISNWVGGLAGLSQLNLRINLPSEIPTPTGIATQVITPTPIPSPIVTPPPAPTNNACTRENENTSCNSTLAPTPAATIDGKKTYAQYCSSCHGSYPGANANKILGGKEADNIIEAINKNKGGLMGALKGRISDAEINVIATYLRTFQQKSAIND